MIKLFAAILCNFSKTKTTLITDFCKDFNFIQKAITL